MALSNPHHTRSYAPRSSPLATPDSTKTRTGATPSRIASSTVPASSPLSIPPAHPRPRNIPPVHIHPLSHAQSYPVDHGPFPAPSTNPTCTPTHASNISSFDPEYNWFTATSPLSPPPFSRNRTRDVVMPVRARPRTAPAGIRVEKPQNVVHDIRRRRVSLHVSKSCGSLESVLEEHEEKDSGDGALPVLRNGAHEAAEMLKGAAWRARWLRFLRIVYSKNRV